MTYSITKQIRIHHDDGWFYQFTNDGEGWVLGLMKKKGRSSNWNKGT